jgi:hypothetical protein
MPSPAFQSARPEVHSPTPRQSATVCSFRQQRHELSKKTKPGVRMFADFESVLPINACGPKDGTLIQLLPTLQLAIYGDHGRGAVGPGGQSITPFRTQRRPAGLATFSRPCWR